MPKSPGRGPTPSNDGLRRYAASFEVEDLAWRRVITCDRALAIKLGESGFSLPAGGGIGRTSDLGANRTRRDGGNDVNDPKRTSGLIQNNSGLPKDFAGWGQTPIRPAAAFALDQLSLGATSSRRTWMSLRWDTRGKKHNEAVERSGVPLFTKWLNFLNWRSPLGSASTFNL